MSEAFKITDLESLNWTFRKLSELQKQRQEIEALAKSERERIEAWENEATKPIDDSMSYFEGLIQAYHMEQLKENPHKKTISTPYGKTKARRSSEKIEKVNEDEILKFAVESNLSDFIKHSIDWSSFKKSLYLVDVDGEKIAVSQDGEIVPGVKVKPESISYSLEVK